MSFRSFFSDPLAFVPTPFAVLATSFALIALGVVVGQLRGSAFSAPFILYYLAIASIPVAVVPAVVALRSHGRIDPFHPLVYFTWSFFLPNFAVAGVLAATGLGYTAFSWLLMSPLDGGELPTNPYFVRIAALGVAVLGTIGLMTGFLGVKYLQDRAKRKSAESGGALAVVAPGTLRNRIAGLFSGYPRPLAVSILLLVAFAALVNAMEYGLFGYRVAPAAVPSYVPVVAFFGQWVFLGIALLMGCLARNETNRAFRALLVLTVVAALALFAISGARGFLYRAVLVAFAADQYARPRLSFKRLITWLVAIVVAVGLAMTYGTTYRKFRNVSYGRTGQTTVQSETALALQVARNMAKIGEEPKPRATVKTPVVDRPHPSPGPKQPTGVLKRGLFYFGERLVGLTDLAIIVKFAEVHQEEEVRRGIDRNIETDFIRSFVPRFLWRDKPIIGPTEEISKLYFGVPNHQPAVTYMGDLYRNYQLPGVFIGMTLFGALVAFIYGALIVGHPSDPVRSAMWITLLLAFNFESLFSIILPNLPRTLFIAALGILIARIGIDRAKLRQPSGTALDTSGE